MTPAELAADLRTRINPVYAAQLGTESYERRICADVIFQLLKESDAQRKVLEQALESLELCSIYAYAGGVGSTASKHKKAITAIQEQLNGQD